ncbi:hypothetical protein D3C73_1377010 [compost metagenome]
MIVRHSPKCHSFDAAFGFPRTLFVHCDRPQQWIMFSATMPTTLVPCFKRLPRRTRQPELPTGIDAIAPQHLPRQVMDRGQVRPHLDIVLTQGKQSRIALLNQAAKRIENLMRDSRRDRFDRRLPTVRHRTNG